MGAEGNVAVQLVRQCPYRTVTGDNNTAGTI